MLNYKLREKEIVSVLVLYWFGTLVMFGSDKQVKQDYWVSILLSAVLMIPMIVLYIRLCRLYPGKNLFDLFYEIYGTKFGTVMSLIYSLYSIFIGFMVLNSFSLFIRNTALKDTPAVIPSILFILVSILACIGGPIAIGHASTILMKLAVGFVYFATIVSLGNLDPKNLLPILHSDFKLVFQSSYHLFILPLAEAFICLSFFSEIDQKENVKKIFIKALVLLISTHLIIALRNVMVLGSFTQIPLFSSISAISIASVADFFSRFEILVGINLVLAGFIKVCVCLYTASLGFSRIIPNTDRKRFIVPCALIMLTISQLVTKQINEVFKIIPYLSVFMMPFEVLFPVITLVVSEIRTRIKAGTAQTGGS